ncbi:GAP family protein [Kitasatospora cathayae]|uniref:GAP family protein n=1 Tax=Kitasatospora cathayae TaxID=3004092 RepID=A0ABY7QES9_9ACTN|nr:GAP family protein [Kitasatospora sp. HUAS 3-15]WBP90904.1 GAP family protein [Kitasatospora sp. HUAS 3-15]
MGEAIGPMLASAVAVALSPLPLIVVLLILASPRGRSNGLAFTAGWVLGLAAVVALVVAAGSALNPGNGEPTWSSWLKLVLGAALLLLAAEQWRDRPRPGHVTAPPAWLLGIDRLTPARSAGLAVALVVARPKTLLPAIGGAASIAAAPPGTGAKVLAAALMVLIGSLGTLLPLAVQLRGADRSLRALGEWRAWTAAHHAAIMTAVPVVLGADYLGGALSGLT